jgi:tRNA pseudouridine55 synthase
MIKKNTDVFSAAREGGLVLFAKRPGFTSFSSLYTIKHALNTSKVGHTGTLDSFASGLLVVCTGPLTRLASRITEFDKEYDAVIRFGAETDTLEWTGSIVRSAPLPQKADVLYAIKQFIGKTAQIPPAFSAIHVDGKRASDLARNGKVPEIPPRSITVYSAEQEEIEYAEGNTVSAIRVRFHVSKGTYIRCLARDIGKVSGSAAYLEGLIRTRVGSFRLEDAAGAELLSSISIANAAQIRKTLSSRQSVIQPRDVLYEEQLQESVRNHIKVMSAQLARECGFPAVHCKPDKEADFRNGKPLRISLFTDMNNFEMTQHEYAVFSVSEKFIGIITLLQTGELRYEFVNSGFTVSLAE